MRIVVLVKPVPDPASAGERLGPDSRLDRAAVPAVVNGNDEYVLEAALKLVEAAGEGEITLLSMAPTNAPETLRKALAMGATRGVHVTDPALAGSCAVSTAKVLAAALRELEFDMVFAGIDSSDGVGGIVPAAVAAHLGLPYLSYAARIEPDMAKPHRPRPPHQRDRLRRARGAAAGRHRRDAGARGAALPVAQGDHGGAQQGDRHALAGGPRAGRFGARRSRGHDGRARQQDAARPGRHGDRARLARRWRRPDRRLPGRAEAHLMGALWVVAEPGPDGGLARISAEAATLARGLGDTTGRDVIGIVVAADPSAAAADLATYLPAVWTITEPAAAEHAWSSVAAGHATAALLAKETPDAIFVGAGADGRDLAGAVSALTGLGVLVNATAVTWGDNGPVVEMSVFGGKLITTSGFTNGRGLITVRPNVTTAAVAATPGQVEARTVDATAALPAVRVVERVSEAGAKAPIEEARIIVAGGRGVGGPDGFGIVEQLAEALGGAVGATRAAVDSGWIPYSQQIGQTGKIVKPELYLALGISGAIQHKVGMRTSGAIVAVNRDPDAPIADFADLFVVGDLFEVGNALLEQLRARSG